MRTVQQKLPGGVYYVSGAGGTIGMHKKWYDYLWIWSILYFVLGFFNILFAWLGMIDFVVPLIFAIVGGNKGFCNRYCGRGQLLRKVGSDWKCSRNKPTPKCLSSKWFRYGFLIFFLTMFGNHDPDDLQAGESLISERVSVRERT